MSPVDELSAELKACFPDVEIETRKSDEAAGFQFLSLYVDDFEVQVEWRRDQGFGISSFHERIASPQGLFEPANEWCTTRQAAFHRIASLVFDRRTTRPRPLKMSELRQERGISQEELSEQLNVRQATYSKLERRGDVKVSSLKRVVEAMGGELVIQAVFRDTKHVREISSQ